MSPEPESQEAAATAAEKDRIAAEAAATAAQAKTDEPLGEKGLSALAAERSRAEQAVKAAKEATKAAKQAQDELDKLRAKDLSDAEQATKRAEAAEAKLATAQTRVRQANLVQALNEAGVSHPKAMARLLDGVEYDDDTDEPQNLDASLQAAKATYGEDMFRPAKRTAADINAGGGGGDQPGPALTPEQLAMAQSTGMSPAEYAHYQNPHAGVYDPTKVTT